VRFVHSRAKLNSWIGDRIKDININDGAEEYGQQPPPRGYSPQPDQVRWHTVVWESCCALLLCQCSTVLTEARVWGGGEGALGEDK
jgi:hypothetical protein